MSAIRQAMVLKLDAGDPFTKNGSKTLREKLQATAKAFKTHKAQNPAEQARFSKHCIEAQRVSSLFATFPSDKKKFRMTSYQGTKACCICTTYIFL